MSVELGVASRGHSPLLGLDLCWTEGRLRFYDPAAGRWLENHTETAARADAERARANAAEYLAAAEQTRATFAETRASAAETRAAAERAARETAEARMAEMEAELRRLRGE